MKKMYSFKKKSPTLGFMGAYIHLSYFERFRMINY